MRYLSENIKKDLARKMVFLAGPRQVGKTTLARELCQDVDLYLNWDIPGDRDLILRRTLPSSGLLVLDEIHKYRQWRNYLKGLYDERGKELRILVTGSAKLDVYRFGGDSLQGRYHLLRLNPLSCRELGISSLEGLNDLIDLSGFPEPYYSKDRVFAKRWSIDYRSRLISEEITSLEQISDLGKLELLALRLPELVGSPLSVNALREDLQVAHTTLARWLEVLERFYFIIRLAPFGSPRIRAIKKEMKHYHFDWSVVQDPGARLENCVAIHLLKWVQYQRDTRGLELELNYFRDQEQREVDFIITERRKPVVAIEVKVRDSDPTRSLRYFKSKFPEVDAVQLYLYGDGLKQTPQGSREYQTKEGIRVLPCLMYLNGLV